MSKKQGSKEEENDFQDIISLDTFRSSSTRSTDKTSELSSDPIPKIYYHQLFRYATRSEKLATILGLIISSASGSIFPVSMIFFAEVVDAFIGPQTALLNAIRKQSVTFSILGAVGLVLGFLQAYLLVWVADRQADRIRLLYFQSLLRQDISWHERNPVGAILSRMNNNIQQIEEGMGGNLANFFRDMSVFIAGIIVAFVQGWKLTLVAIAMIPLISLVFTCLALVIQLYVKVELQAYSEASSFAAEVFTSVKTVFAFGGEKNASERYDRQLDKAQRAGVKKGILLGSSIGMISVSIFSTVAVLFYYGCTLLIDKGAAYEPGTIVLVMMNVVYGSIAVGRAMPLMEFFLKAAGNAGPIFATIERQPPIDIKRDGLKPAIVTGDIEFKNVRFCYPQRPDVEILSDFNLKIKAGETVAIVGPSGSGKSTIVQLIQEHYDPEDGAVYLDGIDIRNLDLGWLRKHVGVVSQEPVLFSGSVEHNIKLGLTNATTKEVVEAAKLANAHDFIKHLPEGYQTWLGEGGASISGGQKQRVAIARTLIRQPQILLLDESTSALDSYSERLVLAAMEKVRRGRTIIMIAHRLSTVRNADRIIVIDRGQIKEMGTHEELLVLNGTYAQMLSQSNEEDEVKTSEIDGGSPSEIDPLPCLSETGSPIGRKSFRESEPEGEVSDVFLDFSLDKKHESVTRRTLKWNKPEGLLMAVGFLGAAVSGAIEPSFALLFAETFVTFQQVVFNNEITDKARLITGLMSAVGFVKLFAQVIQYWLLAITGERLTRRVRRALFEAMLRQEPGWFDRPENQCGILTARLANEAPQLHKVSGQRGGVIVESLAITIITIVLAFYYSWQLALVNMAFLPALVFVGALQVRDVTSHVGEKTVCGSEIVQESLSAQRTVVSLSLEGHFYQAFTERVEEDKGIKTRQRISYSIVNALAQGIQYFQSAAIYYLGAVLIDGGTLNITSMFRSIAVANFGAQGLGRAASFLPDLNSAITSGKNIFRTLDRVTKLDVTRGDIPSNPIEGNIEFRNVKFAYPTRKTVQVLKGFNFNVEKGANVAFVGQSGCGKSTCLQLVQRLYDVENTSLDGGIYIDGKDLRSIQPSWLRQQIGVVAQEPNLFDLTIKENIAYGDLSRSIPMEEITDAARDANIHDFICSLPEGYDTQVGLRGSQLSGGQKQRIAIARALIRKPTILLLDEATSALDTGSERVVQAALSKAMAKSSRTSMVVAHRLNTVEACDKIVVLKDGFAVESGSPSELLARKGHFHALHNLNGIKKKA